MNYVIVKLPGWFPTRSATPLEFYAEAGEFSEMFVRAHIFQDRLTADMLADSLRLGLRIDVEVVPAEIAMEHVFWVRLMWNEQR